MPRARKYLKGDPITTIQQLSNEATEGRYVFMWDRPQHPGWVLSMQFWSLLQLLGHGAFRFAIKNPDYREPTRRKHHE